MIIHKTSMNIHTRFGHKHVFTFILDKYLGVECLDHMVNVFFEGGVVLGSFN